LLPLRLDLGYKVRTRVEIPIFPPFPIFGRYDIMVSLKLRRFKKLFFSSYNTNIKSKFFQALIVCAFDLKTLKNKKIFKKENSKIK
jgi:hypothetical protein